jgi:methionyl aminopeptidase
MSNRIPIRKGSELDGMRKACELARDILLNLAQETKQGATTGDIDRLAFELIKKNGAKSAFLGYRAPPAPPYPGHICLSINDEVVHGIGGKRLIKEGDIVKIDVGVVVDGWIGDNALTVAIGAIPQRTESLLRVTEESLHIAIQHARAGERLGTLCHSVEAHVVPFGFKVVRQYTGHGVGRKLHEEPSVPNFGKAGTGPVLLPGMILAIEPMINEGGAGTKVLDDKWTVVTSDGSPSAHFEHTVLVTEGEPEIMTWRPRSYTSAVTFAG